MSIQVGDALPTAELFIMTDAGIELITTAKLFDAQTVVLFALPGAFTPTCSAQHVPGFLAHADALKAKGVGRIICLSVNDAFVMDAWSKQQKVEQNLLMVADGNGDFTRLVGMELDGRAKGLGIRSQRYAMIVRAGVVEHLAVEPQAGALTVSSAEAILEHL